MKMMTVITDRILWYNYRIVYKYLKKLKITKEFNMQLQHYYPELPHNLHYIDS